MHLTNFNKINSPIPCIYENYRTSLYEDIRIYENDGSETDGKRT